MTANIFGTDSLYVLIIAVVVLFGGSQLPKLARNAGEAMKEFRKAHNDQVTEGAQTAPEALASAPQQNVALPASATPQASQAASSGPGALSDQDRVTLSRSELDALLADRENRAKAASRSEPQA